MDIQFRVWHQKSKTMYYRGYQKLTHILLCRAPEAGEPEAGVPVMRADFDDCIMLQGTGLLDLNGKEIFEGDRVKVKFKGAEHIEIVRDVPDMYKSRNIHPLQSVLDEREQAAKDEELRFEIIGNLYQSE